MHRFRNGVKTAVLIAALAALIIFAGRVIGGTTGVVIATIIALGMNGVAYFYSDKLALRAMHAEPVTRVEAPQLYAMVEELAQKAGQPMPRLYISPQAQPNAFATGRNPEHAAVCCTQGILNLLPPRELRAVLGHELSHVYNRDILISSVAAGLATIITMLANLAWLLPLGGNSRDGNALSGLLLLILGPFAAALIQMSLSRTREYQADASGATLTDDPLALASALEHIEVGVRGRPLPEDPKLSSTGALMIENPFRRGSLAQWFSTHPPVAERVARLRQMAGQ